MVRDKSAVISVEKAASFTAAYHELRATALTSFERQDARLLGTSIQYWCDADHAVAVTRLTAVAQHLPLAQAPEREILCYILEHPHLFARIEELLVPVLNVIPTSKEWLAQFCFVPNPESPDCGFGVLSFNFKRGGQSPDVFLIFVPWGKQVGILAKEYTSTTVYVTTQTLLDIVLLQDDLFGLHASSLSFRGEGIILAGPSNSGKTTLLLALIEQGGLYISDDITLLTSHGVLLPFEYKPLSLNRGTVSYFSRLRQLVQPTFAVGPPPDEYHIWLRNIYGPHVYGEKTRLRALVFPAFDPKLARTTLQCLTVDEALAHLRSEFMPRLMRLSEHFRLPDRTQEVMRYWGNLLRSEDVTSWRLSFGLDAKGAALELVQTFW